SHREARLSKAVLGKIAKLYPQSLFFLLRTSREDMLTIKKQHDQKLNRAKQQTSPQMKSGSPETKPGLASVETAGVNAQDSAGSPKREPNGQIGAATKTAGEQESPQREPPKKPWEYCEDVMAGLKTAFPLLALSM